MQNFTDEAIKYGPWSISKASSAIVCPRQFTYKYVEKLKETAPRTENKIGVAAHSVLELRLLGKPLKDARKEALEKTPLTTKEKEQLQIFTDSIEIFIKRFDLFCKDQGIVDLLIEQKWALDANLAPTGFFSSDVFFRGVVDLAGITKEKDLIVIDHKSGKVQPIKKHQPQLNSYAVMGLANNPDIQGVQSVIHYLQPKKEDDRMQWNPYVSSDVIKNNLNSWLIEYINDTAVALTDPQKTNAKKPWPCDWCAYNTICDAYKAIGE